MSPRLVVDNTAPKGATPHEDSFGFCIGGYGIVAVRNGISLPAGEALIALADCVGRHREAAEARINAALSTPGGLR